MPGNSREDSEHQKQYWNGGLRAVRVSEWLPEGISALRNNVVVIKIRNAEARCDFVDIPAGTYAMAVVHDENMNGKLDTNWFGVPEEGYGFSNDARGRFAAPLFSEASFTYDGRNADLTMSLHY